MSFLSDLVEGQWGNLGNDLSHAPESFVNHPTEMLEAAGGAAALAAPFVLPELLGAGGAAFGLGGEAAAAGGDALAFTGAETGAEVAGGGAQQAITDLLAGGAGDSAIPQAATSSMGTWTDVGLGGAGNVPYVDGGLPGFTGDVAGAGSPITDSSILTGPAASGNPGMTAAEWGAANPTGGAGGGGSFIDKLLAGTSNQITQHPFQSLGALAGAGGLAYNMMQGQKPLPNQRQLQGQADQLSAQGQQFMSFLQSGTLPPGLKAQVDQAAASAKATIISNAARNGQSTDPTQNTALAQQLAQADQNALIAVASLGEKLFSAGAQEVGLSTQIYERLMQIDQQQTASMGKAIANFAAALGGGMRVNA